MLSQQNFQKSTLSILENTVYPFDNNGDKSLIIIAILTVSHTTMGSEGNSPVNWIRQI